MELIEIWQQSEHYAEVIQFWKDLNALPPQVKPEKRAEELVMVARANGKVAGVTTAFRSKIGFLNDNHFFVFRILIHPDHRVPGLASKLTVKTRDFLESLYTEKQTDCIGMIVYTDKKELMTLRREAVWRASKMVFIGTTREGKHIRLYYFKGARI